MKAWQLIDKPEKWTTKAYARNEGGFSVNALDKDACSFCTLGAIYNAYKINGKWEGPIGKLERKIGGSIVNWNDARDINKEVNHA